MPNPNRTTLLINCSVEEAHQIRAAAKKEDRTISAYLLRAVKTRLTIQAQLEERQQNFFVKQIR
jgi:hypothetical protein